MYSLRSKMSFMVENFGMFDSVAEAVEHGIWCGLPGEELEVVRHDGIVMASLVAPESKLSLMDLASF
jgi:hypothetical protein